MKLNDRFALAVVAMAAIPLFASGCSTAGAVVTEPPDPKPSTVAVRPAATDSLPIDLSLDAVSASAPTTEAAGVLAACHVGDMITIDKVSGMAELPSAVDLPHFVPFTGREPQLKASGTVWVVQIRGDVQQRGNEIWTNPTCVVTSDDAGYFATGPVTNTATGKTIQPEAPPTSPDRALPSLAP
jgi:hypothetical protein